jgi:hypothetical protein
MTEKLKPEEVVTFKELLMSNGKEGDHPID